MSSPNIPERPPPEKADDFKIDYLEQEKGGKHAYKVTMGGKQYKVRLYQEGVFPHDATVEKVKDQFTRLLQTIRDTDTEYIPDHVNHKITVYLNEDKKEVEDVAIEGLPGHELTPDPAEEQSTTKRTTEIFDKYLSDLSNERPQTRKDAKAEDRDEIQRGSPDKPVVGRDASHESEEKLSLDEEEKPQQPPQAPKRLKVAVVPDEEEEFKTAHDPEELKTVPDALIYLQSYEKIFEDLSNIVGDRTPTSKEVQEAVETACKHFPWIRDCKFAPSGAGKGFEIRDRLAAHIVQKLLGQHTHRGLPETPFCLTYQGVEKLNVPEKTNNLRGAKNCIFNLLKGRLQILEEFKTLGLDLSDVDTDTLVELYFSLENKDEFINKLNDVGQNSKTEIKASILKKCTEFRAMTSEKYSEMVKNFNEKLQKHELEEYFVHFHKDVVDKRGYIFYNNQRYGQQGIDGKRLFKDIADNLLKNKDKLKDDHNKILDQLPDFMQEAVESEENFRSLCHSLEKGEEICNLIEDAIKATEDQELKSNIRIRCLLAIIGCSQTTTGLLEDVGDAAIHSKLMFKKLIDQGLYLDKNRIKYSGKEDLSESTIEFTSYIKTDEKYVCGYKRKVTFGLLPPTDLTEKEIPQYDFKFSPAAFLDESESFNIAKKFAETVSTRLYGMNTSHDKIQEILNTNLEGKEWTPIPKAESRRTLHTTDWDDGGTIERERYEAYGTTRYRFKDAQGKVVYEFNDFEKDAYNLAHEATYLNRLQLMIDTAKANLSEEHHAALDKRLNTFEKELGKDDSFSKLKGKNPEEQYNEWEKIHPKYLIKLKTHAKEIQQLCRNKSNNPNFDLDKEERQHVLTRGRPIIFNRFTIKLGDEKKTFINAQIPQREEGTIPSSIRDLPGLVNHVVSQLYTVEDDGTITKVNNDLIRHGSYPMLHKETPRERIEAAKDNIKEHLENLVSKKPIGERLASSEANPIEIPLRTMMLVTPVKGDRIKRGKLSEMDQMVETDAALSEMDQEVVKVTVDGEDVWVRPSLSMMNMGTNNYAINKGFRGRFRQLLNRFTTAQDNINKEGFADLLMDVSEKDESLLNDEQKNLKREIDQDRIVLRDLLQDPQVGYLDAELRKKRNKLDTLEDKQSGETLQREIEQLDKTLKAVKIRVKKETRESIKAKKKAITEIQKKRFDRDELKDPEKAGRVKLFLEAQEIYLSGKYRTAEMCQRFQPLYLKIYRELGYNVEAFCKSAKDRTSQIDNLGMAMAIHEQLTDDESINFDAVEQVISPKVLQYSVGQQNPEWNTGARGMGITYESNPSIEFQAKIQRMCAKLSKDVYE